MMHASAISPPTSFREFSDRMNSGDTSELDSFCRALSCSFLGSELARFPASGRPPSSFSLPTLHLHSSWPECSVTILERGFLCFTVHYQLITSFKNPGSWLARFPSSQRWLCLSSYRCIRGEDFDREWDWLFVPFWLILLMTRKTRRQPFQRKISWKWTQEKGFRLKVHTGQCPGGSQNIFSPQFEVAFDDRGKKKQWEANAVVNQGREREVWVCSFVKLPNRTQAVQHHLHFCILGLTAKCFDIDSKCFQKASILFQNVLYLWLKLSIDFKVYFIFLHVFA